MVETLFFRKHFLTFCFPLFLLGKHSEKVLGNFWESSRKKVLILSTAYVRALFWETSMYCFSSIHIFFKVFFTLKLRILNLRKMQAQTFPNSIMFQVCTMVRLPIVFKISIYHIVPVDSFTIIYCPCKFS